MSSRGLGLLALAAAFAWTLVRPLLYGAPPDEPLRFGLFLLAYVIGPGWILYRPLRAPDEDDLAALGMAWTIGWIAQTLAFLLLRVADATAWFPLYPLLVLPLLRRARPRAAVPGPSLPHLALLLAILLVAIERTPLFPATGWWREHSHDLLFHAGNAAELRDHWPMRDPRAAALPLNYHFFAYALPAGASAVMGLPVASLLLRVGAATLPLLLVLQVYNAGRAFGGRAAAGLIAAGIVALAVDLGAGVQVLSPERAHAFRFDGTLDVGIWRSLTTVSGLVLFTSLAIVLRRWLASGRTLPAREALLAALLAFAASGTKGSVMPVVVASLGAFAVFRRKALLPLVVCALAAAPMSLYLALGEHAWAASIFSLAPGETMRASGFYVAAAKIVDAPWLLALPWIVGHLGLAGAIFLLRRPLGASPLRAEEIWLALVLLVGLALALLLDSTGRSQLFFLHNGQLGLAILAGSALASIDSLRKRAIAASLALVFFAVPTLAGGLADLGRNLLRDVASLPPEPPLARAYAEGLAWIRDRAPKDAVLVVRHPSIVISCFGERRTFLETVRFSPEAFARRGSDAPGVPHAELGALRDRLFAGASDADWTELLGRLSTAGPIYVVVDDVRSESAPDGSRYRFGPAPTDAPPWIGAALQFSNEAIRIWR